LTSRKQFGFSKQHDEPTFFLDRTFGRRKLAGALKTAGFRIEVHDDHFPQDEPDPSWLKACGERGWIVLTADGRIERKWSSLIKSLGVGVFIITSNNAPAVEWARPLEKYRSRILRTIRKNPPPFIAHMTQGGITKMNTFGPPRKNQAREAGKDYKDDSKRS
jgi:hypothetical protein